MDSDSSDIESALAAPFEEHEVKFKPAVVTGSRALALPYVDARAIQDRLDSVLGVAGWQTSFEFLPDGACLCRLRLKINGEWIEKQDVGGPSEQPDEGDRRKAAVSDALKRAAVQAGIGRYLYRQEAQWVDYDAQKKKFARPPRLPSPPPTASLKATPAPAPAPAPAPTSQSKPAVQLPKDGTELKARLETKEKLLVLAKLCRAGDLLAHVRAEGKKAGQPDDLEGWTAAGIALAGPATKQFEEERRKKPVLKITG